MAALTRAGQGNSPATLQIVPGIEAVGGEGQTGVSLVTPIPIMVKLVWDRLPQPTVYLLVAGQELQSKVRGMPKYPKMARVILQIRRTPVHFSFCDGKVGDHMAWECATQPNC